MTTRLYAAEALEAMVERGEYQAAYEAALPLLSQRAGEPGFDFLFGLAALEAGHPQEAVFAFDRLLALMPWDHRSRLELARAHFMLGNYERAEKHFRLVLATEPPPRVRENIEQFLDSMAERGKLRDHQLGRTLEFEIGYDTNINSATTVDSISLPIGLNLTLGETSRKLGDEFAELNAGLNYMKLLRKDMGYFLSASFSERHNSSYSQFDTRLLGLGGGYIQKTGGQTWRVPLQYQYLAVDGERFRGSLGLGLEWSIEPFKAAQAVVFSQWAQQRHTADERLRDADLALLGAGISYEFRLLKVTLGASFYLADESAKESGGEHFGRAYQGARLTAGWAPHAQHSFQLSTATQATEHDAIHPAFALLREDSYSQLGLEWQWQFDAAWRFSYALSHANNDSNIPIYTYNRSQQSLALRYVF